MKAGFNYMKSDIQSEIIAVMKKYHIWSPVSKDTEMAFVKDIAAIVEKSLDLARVQHARTMDILIKDCKKQIEKAVEEERERILNQIDDYNNELYKKLTDSNSAKGK